MQASRHSEKCEGVGGFLAFIIAWSPPAFHVRHACMHAYGLLLLKLHAEQQRGGIHTYMYFMYSTYGYLPSNTTVKEARRFVGKQSKMHRLVWFDPY